MDFLSFCESLGCEIKPKEPLRRHTTFRIGGPADLVILPPEPYCDEMPPERSVTAQVLKTAQEHRLELRFIGRGSNVLMPDEGLSAYVLKWDETATPQLLDDTTVYAGAGVSLSALCLFAQKNGLSGLEFAYGIPASVGGALYMNAGAYSGEMKDVVAFADTFASNGEFHRLSATQLNYGYRHSVFMEDSQFGAIISGGVFTLQKEDPAEIKKRMETHMAARKSKQPLEYPSAGSTFQRPKGAYAAALIDECGLKGVCVGGACVSEKHAGIVINKNNATAADVLALMELIRQTVHDKTGFDLQPEVRLFHEGSTAQ